MAEKRTAAAAHGKTRRGTAIGILTVLGVMIVLSQLFGCGAKTAGLAVSGACGEHMTWEYDRKTATLTMQAYIYIGRGEYGTAAAFAAILTVITAISLFIYMAVSKSEDVRL